MVNAKFEALKVKDHLPSPKGVALKIIQLTLREDITNHEIADAIKTDPALSGRILKMSNVLMSYQTRPIASIADAVMTLGLRTVRDVVLGLSLMDGSREGACRKFDYQNFWSRSLLTAIAAKNMVIGSGMGAPEEIFILGLLGQVGSLGLATAYPEEYSSILAKVAGATPTDIELIDLERTEFGLDHNQLTKEMLSDWGLPQVFQIAALHHENPVLSGLAEGNRNWYLLNVLHVANHFSKMCLSHEKQRHKMVQKLIVISTKLGLEVNKLTDLGDKAVKEWREWSKLFGISSVELPPLKQILEASSPTELEIHDVGISEIGLETSYALRILLVDDDYATTLMLRLLLTKAGHKVATAGNGVEALSMVSKFMPQLIITDWHMPEMNGIEFCKEIRRNQLWRNIHVFVMIVQEGTDSLGGIFEAGATDYLTKPVNSKVLGAKLFSAQRIVQLQDELNLEHKQLRSIAAELAASNHRLEQMALTDVLTELPNRRHANDYMEQQWAMAERSGRPLSCMMVDVDSFKNVNDTYGHKIGDDVLKRVAQILRSSARKQDMVCRFGGEEFLVVCPDADAEQVYQYAERLRQKVAEGNIHMNLIVTISIGVSTKQSTLLNAEMLIQLADKRLFIAKKLGRNRTVGN